MSLPPASTNDRSSHANRPSSDDTPSGSSVYRGGCSRAAMLGGAGRGYGSITRGRDGRPAPLCAKSDLFHSQEQVVNPRATSRRIPRHLADTGPATGSGSEPPPNEAARSPMMPALGRLRGQTLVYQTLPGPQ